MGSSIGLDATTACRHQACKATQAPRNAMQRDHALQRLVSDVLIIIGIAIGSAPQRVGRSRAAVRSIPKGCKHVAVSERHERDSSMYSPTNWRRTLWLRSSWLPQGARTSVARIYCSGGMSGLSRVVPCHMQVLSSRESRIVARVHAVWDLCRRRGSS